MNAKQELLTIGQIAKLSGVGTRALHYYERKNLVKPAYIDPQTGYRYYSPEQLPLLDIISGCVMLDIPLKDLAQALEAQDMQGLYRFFETSKQVAQKRIQMAAHSVRSIDRILERMDNNDTYALGQLHARSFSEKLYAIKPYDPALHALAQPMALLQLVREHFQVEYNRQTALQDLDHVVALPDYGHLHWVSSTGTQTYAFAEATPKTDTDQLLIVPAGVYPFRHDTTCQIAQAPQLFQAQLAHLESYLLIETEEPFLSQTKVSEPRYELRLVGL